MTPRLATAVSNMQLRQMHLHLYLGTRPVRNRFLLHHRAVYTLDYMFTPFAG